MKQPLTLFAVFFLVISVFVGSAAVVNENFNIGERAIGIDKANCSGCSGKYELKWVKKKGEEGECKKRESYACNKAAVEQERAKANTCPGTCVTQGGCASQGLVNATGSCIKGYCCTQGVSSVTKPWLAQPP